MTTPHPAPELKKLDYFVGTWKIEGEIKPSPMGPAGKLIETDHNQWMEGGFFLVVHSEFIISGAPGATGVAYMGYDSRGKAYTYDEFNSLGDAIHSLGSFDGVTWTWCGERKTESGVARTRWTVKISSSTSYDFRFETSTDEQIWSTVVTGKATKK